MEVSVCWFPCLVAADAGVRGLEGWWRVLTAWWFPWRAGLWEKGGEDGAGPEHLRSGDGAGGARVLLLLRRNRARRHQIVSAYWFLWLLVRLLLLCFSSYHLPVYLHCHFGH
jgi:hypothetical protein